MEKKYCSYELSILAKQAGFDEKCDGIYSRGILVHTFGLYANSTIWQTPAVNGVTAPELTHLQQWVYEKFKVWISTIEYPPYVYGNFNCPYNALESGLMEFLKTKNL